MSFFKNLFAKIVAAVKQVDAAAGKFLIKGEIEHHHLDFWNIIGMCLGLVEKAKNPDSTKPTVVWLGFLLLGPFVQAGTVIGLKKFNRRLRIADNRIMVKRIKSELMHLQSEFEAGRLVSDVVDHKVGNLKRRLEILKKDNGFCK